MTSLLLTVCFLDNRYHGLLSRKGPSEWPPSPFRLFSALVCGVGRRGELESDIGKSLEWLQALEPPIILGPQAKTGQAITRFVPNNDGDKKPDRQERLTAKLTIPTLMMLRPDERPEVHYLWDVDGRNDVPIDQIRDAARSLTTLGWGVDMAFADARLVTEAEIQKLKGVRWHPTPGAWRDDGMLRVPTSDADLQECTLCELKHSHQTAIARIEHGQPLNTVDKPRVFDRVLYTSVERSIGRPFAVFKLLDENEDAYRYPHAKFVHITGMVRHVAIETMTHNPPQWIHDPAEWVNRIVRGKRDESAGDGHTQFSYVPLPSIGHAHADAMIRSVMVVVPLGMERELGCLAERLDGQALKPEGDAASCETDSSPRVSGRIELRKFNPLQGKFIDTCYLGTSRIWHSVTPVILDGHNDKKAGKTIKLIQTALMRAGIETPCDFTWQAIPFLKNCLSAHKYDRSGRHTGYHRPTHLRDLTAVHVRLTFEHPVPGPLMIGAGRHCGFGLMAGMAP